MTFSIFVMFSQVGLEAYILGTLFHYVVKKDAKLEEFRQVLLRWLSVSFPASALLQACKRHVVTIEPAYSHSGPGLAAHSVTLSR